MEKLGEADKRYNYSELGYSFDFHFVARGNSKEWLSYWGRLGDYWEQVYIISGVTTASPRTPYHSGDYYYFPIDYSYNGFGNIPEHGTVSWY